MKPCDVLFVHNNFPGQFGFIAEALPKGGRAAAIASSTGKGVPGIPLLRWRLTRGTTEGIFRDAIRAEADFLRGRAAAECALTLRKQGFEPRIIVGHPGWGETIYLREIFPDARQVLYGEFYYRSRGADVDFDPEFGMPSLEEQFRVHAKNATMVLALSEADRIVSPTPFQASLLPDILRSRLSIIHEGVDTDQIRARPGVKVAIGNGPILDRSTPVVTFINRRFEPLRGYHVFMRALPKVLAAVPGAHVLLIGADEAGGYGRAAPQGSTWGKRFLAEVSGRLDLSRVHFLGRVPHATMLDALSISTAHVYFTYPFVLSWSLLEAMASECLIIASDTAPVRDAVENGTNGLLLDFFDTDALADALIEACRRPEAFGSLRRAARETVLSRFDRKRHCIPAWATLLQELAA